MNKPLEISLTEWIEIMQVPLVKETWPLVEDNMAEDFASYIYGVKFDFTDGMSGGYTGDLFILLDNDIRTPPVRLVRVGGRLAAQLLDKKYG
jgi:hypothetical protein